MQNINVESCPYCLNEKCFFLGKHNEYKLYKCGKCDLQFFTPREYDNTVYESSKVGGIYEQYHNLRTIPTMWLLEMIKWFKRRDYSFEGKKIIEIGAGDALNFFFLSQNFALTTDQYEILEFDSKSVEACKKRGLTKIHQTFFNEAFAEQHKNEYDIVIVTEVIEHQADLKIFLDSLFGIINQSGVILLSTPNNSRPFSWIGNKTDMPPHHFLRFSKEFFVKNLGEYILSHSYYFFTPLIMKEYARAVSYSKFKTNNFWLLFYPIFWIKNIVARLINKGEGHFIVFSNR